ncbi:DUF975 family protein [Streptococcus hyointestinalis]|uniref:DUF975 family protein n=1 Tax=Streptococcus hyointestinalis TaxID=1337 RepID=UPI003F996336
MRISDIKTTARRLIAGTKGSYALYAIAIMLVYASLLLGFTPSETGVGFNLTSLLISILTLFFTLSANFTMLLVARNQKQSVQFSDNQLAFSRHYVWRLLLLYIVQGIFLMLLLGVALLGGSLIVLGNYLVTIDTTSYYPLAFTCLGWIFSVYGVIAVVRYYFAYRMTAYIAFDRINRDPDNYPGTLAIIKDSIALMKGHKWRLFLLDVSFILWYLLILMTFGLAYIYVLPYTNASEVVFYEQLKKA